jgi:hypothetical protein
MPLVAIALLCLVCAFTGGSAAAALALAGGLPPVGAVLLSLPAAVGASYAGWRAVSFGKPSRSGRRAA